MKGVTVSCISASGLAVALKLNMRTGLNSLIQIDILLYQTTEPLESRFEKAFRDLWCFMSSDTGEKDTFFFLIYKEIYFTIIAWY